MRYNEKRRPRARTATPGACLRDKRIAAGEGSRFAAGPHRPLLFNRDFLNEGRQPATTDGSRAEAIRIGTLT